jgi:hypothetical protein
MRWYIDIAPMGGGPRDVRMCLEAAHWQPALVEARRIHGDGEGLVGLSVEFLEEGCRAVDPARRVRYEVLRAPDDARIDHGKSEPAAGRDERAAPASAAKSAAKSDPAATVPARPAGTAREEPPSAISVTLGSIESPRPLGPPRPIDSAPGVVAPPDPEAPAPPSRGASSGLGKARAQPTQLGFAVDERAPVSAADAGGAPLEARSGGAPRRRVDNLQKSTLRSEGGEPSYRLLGQRRVDATPAAPIRYEERMYGASGPTNASDMERFVRAKLAEIESTLADEPPGKLVAIAVFDHVFDTVPKRPPVLTLEWRDWRERPEIRFDPYGASPVGSARAYDEARSVRVVPAASPPPPPESARPKSAPAAKAASVAKTPVPPAGALKPAHTMLEGTPASVAKTPVPPAGALKPAHTMLEGTPASVAKTPVPPAGALRPAPTMLEGTPARARVDTPGSRDAPQDSPASGRRDSRPEDLPPGRGDRPSRRGRQSALSRRLQQRATGERPSRPGAEAAPRSVQAVSERPAPDVEEKGPTTPRQGSIPARTSAAPAAGLIPTSPTMERTVGSRAARSRRALRPSEPPGSEGAAAEAQKSTAPGSHAPGSKPATPSQPAASEAPSSATVSKSSLPPPADAREADLRRRASSIPPRPARGGRRLHDDELLTDMFEGIHELHHLPDVIAGAEFVLNLALAKLPSQVGLVSLFDIDRREFVVVRQTGGEASALLLRLSERHPIARQAMRTGRAVVLTDTSQARDKIDPRWDEMGTHPHSLLCAPVEVGGRYLGLIELANPQDGRAYQESDGHALSYLGRQFAEFVEQRGVIIDPEKVLAALEQKH